MSFNETPFLIKRTDDAKDLPLPSRATPMSAGMDLRANVQNEMVIAPGERKRVPTGIKIALPFGYEAQIRARSGLALKFGIGTVNSPATIDADYRGELTVLLINWGSKPFVIQRGDRIAQIVICEVVMKVFTEAENLPESTRGEGGFGHSGHR